MTRSRRQVASRRLFGDFGRLWFATAATALGTQIGQLAVPLLAVVVLNASPGEVGLIGTVQWAPFIFIALPLGLLVDRRRRRPLLVGAEVVRAASAIAIIASGVFGALSIPLLLALVAVGGCGTVLFEVAYQSFLPSIVPIAKLEIANSRLQSTEATALVAGPGLGGIMVQLIGALPALAVTAAGSILSAISLTSIPESTVRPRQKRESPAREILAGVRFVLHDRVLAGLLGFSAISNPFAQWILLLFLVDGVRRLHLSAGQVGLILAIGAVGTLLGAATAPLVAKRLGSLRLLVLSAVVDPLALFALPLATPASEPALLILCLGLAFAVNGYAIGLSNVVSLTIRQLRIPEPLRGRVNAATRMVSYGTIAIGAALGGLVGQFLGTRLGILIGCLGALVAALWVGGWGILIVKSKIPLDVPAPPQSLGTSFEE